MHVQKKERCFPVTLQLGVSCCGGEKNPCTPKPSDGNSLGNSLGRALKSGGRWEGASLGQAALMAPGKPLLQHQQRCYCFPSRGGRQSHRVWEDPICTSEENSAPCLACSPALGSSWAREGDAPCSSIVWAGLWGRSPLALAKLACE